jgi:ATP-dependent Lon protease
VKEVEQMLGAPVFTKEKPLRGVGVVTGLAWTAMGGATLPVEATRVHTLNARLQAHRQARRGDEGVGGNRLQLRDVAPRLRRDPEFFDESMVHLHVPEGATPKDGPSAGVTMATALISLARVARHRSAPLAMTGELTLTGQVLAVGGIREKVIAARRVGIGELVLPEANRKDFDGAAGLPARGPGGALREALRRRVPRGVRAPVGRHSCSPVGRHSCSPVGRHSCRRFGADPRGRPPG